MAESNENLRKTKIFISYSRKDKPFVQKLNDAIDAAGIDAWVDWEGIPLSSDWMKEITAAIEAGDAFVYVISPDSLSSKICDSELDLGIKANKKIIPVLHREPEKGQSMHPKLASTNWVYMRDSDDFDATIPKLVETIQTDLGWVQQHTRLLQRANEWEQKSRNNSYLLLGADLEDGERWMTESTTGPGRAVAPAQAEYISTSRKVAVQRQRRLTIGIGVALLVSVFLGVFAFIQRGVAVENEKKAVSSQFTAVANANIAATQRVIAEDNAQKAKAQRSASDAKIYQDQAGELDASTLLAVNAYQHLPGLASAENILRNNISLLAAPIKKIDLGGRIWTIQPSPDREKFATASEDGQACVWNMKDGAKIFCTQLDGGVNTVTFSADGKILVAGTSAGVLAFLDASNGKIKASLKFDGKIFDLSLHPEGKIMAVGRTNAVSLIDMTTFKEKLFFLQEGDASKIDFDSTGANLAVGTSKGYVTIWSMRDGKTIAGLRHDKDVFDVSFSPDDAWLISVGADSKARALQVSARAQKYAVKHGDWVEDVTFGPDSSWYLTASDDNFVRVIDAATGQERMRMKHSGFVQKVRMSADGQWIASTGFDQTARVWDAVTGAEVLQIPINGIGSSLQFNSDSTRLVVGDRNGQITLWDVSQLKARKGFAQFPEFLHEAHFSPNGKWIALNSDDKNIWVIPADQFGAKEDNRKKIAVAGGLTYGMALSADAQWVAAVEYDADVSAHNRVILAAADGSQTRLLDHKEEVINAAVFTPDSKQILSADATGLINIWDVASGKQIGSLNAGESVFSMAFSPNGKFLATGLEAGNLIIWDFAAQKQIATLAQTGTIAAVQFSPDGKLLASGSFEKSMRLWNAADGSFSVSAEFSANGEVDALGFRPDNKQLAIGDSAGYVYIWDVALGQEIARLPHEDKVTSVNFSPDGKQLVSVSRKTALVWNTQIIPTVTRENLIETACSRLTENFSENKWKLFFFEEKYRLICPNLPVGKN